MVSITISKKIQQRVAIDIFIENNKNNFYRNCLERNTLFNMIYKEHFSEKDIALMNSLPAGFLNEDSGLRFYSQNGNTYFLHFRNPKDQIRSIIAKVTDIYYNHLDEYSIEDYSPTILRFPAEIGRIFISEKTNDYWERIRDFDKEMVEELKKILITVKQGFAQFTTLKKCEEDWPEILPYLNKYTNRDSKQEIAVVVSELNSILNIPKK